MIYKISDLHVDVDNERVTRDEEGVPVRGLNFDLLRELIKKSPNTVDISHLAGTVWKQQVVSDDTIAQRIKLLRQVLGDSAKAQRYITTVRHKGYRLTVPAEPVSPQGGALSGPVRRLVAPLVALFVVVAIFAFTVLDGDPAGQLQPLPAGSVTQVGSAASLQVRRARELLHIHSPSGTDQAIALLESALQENPDLVPARLTLSFAYSQRLTKFSGSESDNQRAEDLARGLLREDISLAAAWHALAYALDSQGLIDEAVAAYENAYRLDPDDAAAISSAAYLLKIRGRLHDALQLEAMALQVAPPTLYGPVQIATAYSLMGHDAAQAWWQRANLVGAEQLVVQAELMTELLRNGHPQQVLDSLAGLHAELQELPRLQRLAGRAALAMGQSELALVHFDAAGQEAELERVALKARTSRDIVDRNVIENAEMSMISGNSWPELRVRVAEVYASAGQADKALDLLSRAIDLGWRDMPWLERSPFLVSLHETPQWRVLQQRTARLLNAQTRLVAGSMAIEQMTAALSAQ